MVSLPLKAAAAPSPSPCFPPHLIRRECEVEGAVRPARTKEQLHVIGDAAIGRADALELAARVEAGGEEAGAEVAGGRAGLMTGT
jgi:hypothetical protein